MHRYQIVMFALFFCFCLSGGSALGLSTLGPNSTLQAPVATPPPEFLLSDARARIGRATPAPLNHALPLAQWTARYYRNETCWSGAHALNCPVNADYTELFSSAFLDRDWSSSPPDGLSNSGTWTARFEATISFSGSYHLHFWNRGCFRIFLRREGTGDFENTDCILDGVCEGKDYESWCHERLRNLSGSYRVLILYLHRPEVPDPKLRVEWTTEPCHCGTPIPSLTPTAVTRTPTPSLTPPYSPLVHWAAKYYRNETCWSWPHAVQCPVGPNCEEPFIDYFFHRDWRSSLPCGFGTDETWTARFEATISFSGNYHLHFGVGGAFKVYLRRDGTGDFENTDCILDGVQEPTDNGWWCHDRLKNLSGSYRMLILYLYRPGTSNPKLTVEWTTDTCHCGTPTPSLTPRARVWLPLILR